MGGEINLWETPVKHESKLQKNPLETLARLPASGGNHILQKKKRKILII